MTCRFAGAISIGVEVPKHKGKGRCGKVGIQVSIGQIEKTVSGKLLRGDPQVVCCGASTDTRTISPGEVFFAIKGERFDGHDFVSAAIEKGAGCVVVSNETAFADVAQAAGEPHVIAVSDVKKALQDLARWYLSTLNIKKIGITGSTGKTSTKDILGAICAEKFKTAKTPGNWNNEIGVPLTALGFEADVQVGVFEMGAGAVGDIRLLADIVKPDIAIITNVGVSHLETFGSRENILKGKMEIADFLEPKSLLIINGENDLLTRSSAAGPYRLQTVGTSGKNEYILSDIGDLGGGVCFTLEKPPERHRFETALPGRHNAINAALAIAAALALGMRLSETEAGLRKVVLTEKRMSVKGKDGLKIIDDTYNASPESMRAAIDELMAIKGMRKVAILGDMLELGGEAKMYHEEIGAYVAFRGVDRLIAIGNLSEEMAKAASRRMAAEQVCHFKNKENFLPELKKLIEPGDVILVKGSRGLAMEQIVKKIME